MLAVLILTAALPLLSGEPLASAALRSVAVLVGSLALAVLSLLAAALAGVVGVAIVSARSQFYGGMEWHAGHQLAVRMGSALYTGIAALLLSFVFRPLTGAMGLLLGRVAAASLASAASPRAPC